MTISSVMDTKVILERISANGIRVDRQGAMEHGIVLETEEQQLFRKLDVATNYHELRSRRPGAFSKTDVHFNPRSKKHINALLVDRGEEETHSVAEQNLEIRLPDLASLIMETRRVRIYMGALSNLLKWSRDGYVHVSWSEAATGRWYTGEPPIQTMAKIARGYMVPERGKAFYILDWRQQELRILAHLSQEPAFLEVFDTHGDPHKMAYERVTGKQVSSDPDVLAKQRDIGKMLNYALIYGLDAQGLGGRLKIPNERAQKLIDAYFGRLPTLVDWRAKQAARVRSTGYAETIIGRRIPVRLDMNRRDAEARFERAAVNYCTQGSAADQMRETLKRIWEHGNRNNGSNMVDMIRCQIHDAFLIECEPGSGYINWFQKAMEIPVGGISSPVDIKGPAPSWKECMDWIDSAEPTPAEV